MTAPRSYNIVIPLTNKKIVTLHLIHPGIQTVYTWNFNKLVCCRNILCHQVSEMYMAVLAAVITVLLFVRSCFILLFILGIPSLGGLIYSGTHYFVLI